MTCDDIRGLLTDYMTRELGGARSDLVRQHLLHCAACRDEAASIQAALELLQAGAATGAAPEHLSPDRRRHIVWSVAHPVMAWIIRHHGRVSVLIAVVIMLLVLWGLQCYRVVERRPAEPAISVRIGWGQAPATTNAPPPGP